MRLAVCAAVLMMIAPAALGFSFCDLCDSFRLVQRGDALLLYCPGNGAPVLTFEHCPKARASNNAGHVTINCSPSS